MRYGVFPKKRNPLRPLHRAPKPSGMPVLTTGRRIRYGVDLLSRYRRMGLGSLQSLTTISLKWYRFAFGFSRLIKVSVSHISVPRASLCPTVMAEVSISQLILASYFL